MIYCESTITTQNGVSTIDSPILLYRGDREIEVVFTIIQNKFKFASGDNLILRFDAHYGQLVIDRPDDEFIVSDISRCEEGKIKFTITKEMIDELVEVGYYSIQIRLFNEDKSSRITLPLVENALEVKEPMIAEDDIIPSEIEFAYKDEELTVSGVNVAYNSLNEDLMIEGLTVREDVSKINGYNLKDAKARQELINKQDELISGSNIKTINGQSILGNGDITINEGENVDLSEYVTKEELNNKAYLTSVPSEYITESELNAKGYLTEHQDISHLATESFVRNEIANAQLGGDANVDLSGYATKDELNAKADVDDIPTNISQLTNDAGYITSIPSEYITETELNNKGYLTEHQNISHLATKTELFSKNYNDLINKPTIPTSTSQLTNDNNYATVSQIPSIPTSLPANGGNSNTVNGFSIWCGTQVEYDSIGTKSDTTIYLIKE